MNQMNRALERIHSITFASKNEEYDAGFIDGVNQAYQIVAEEMAASSMGRKLTHADVVAIRQRVSSNAKVSTQNVTLPGSISKDR
jgi:pyrimidine deaminase RibD-like protein